MTNPLVLCLIVAVVAVVVSARRTDAPWATGFKAYIILGFVIIGIRVFFRMLLDGQHGAHVLFRLPEVPLPDAAAGIRLGGPVSLEGILAAIYDGLRLATLLICLGSANVLANPKRLLKSVPSALYEIGSAVTVALSVAPQLVESGRRVMRARALRGDTGRRTHWFRQVAIPVMTDALDRSLLLAAAMDSRGYGRTGGATRSARLVTAAFMIGGLGGLCVGVYGLLDSSTPRLLGGPMLLIGVALCAAGMYASGAQVQRTRYRPDRWRIAETGVALVGIGVGAVMYISSSIDPTRLNPSLQPLTWPELPLIPTAAVLCGLLAAVIAPPPVRLDLADAANDAWRRGPDSDTDDDTSSDEDRVGSRRDDGGSAPGATPDDAQRSGSVLRGTVVR